MRVCFFPSDLDAPGCYRCLFPARVLREELGVDARMAPYRARVVDEETGHAKFLFDLRDLEAVGADVYVFQQAKQEDALLAVRRLREAGKVVVCESDDWYLGTPAYNPGFGGAQPWDVELSADREGRVVRKRTSRAVHRNWMFRLFSEADCLTVATPVLADGYRRYNPNVVVLRNYLDWDMWGGVEQQSEVDRGGRVRVGWMGRMVYRGGDLALLRGLIGPWLERNPHVDFVAAGDGDELHDWLGVPVGQRVSYPSVHFRDLKLPEITAVMDVGLVPLEANRFNDAKSHLKGMEYAACGIPCVASPADSYRNYWLAGDEGRVGMLARRPRDWIRALDLLVNDHEVRRQMGRQARVKASEHTIQKNAWRWKELYGRLVSGSPRRSTVESAAQAA